MESQNETQNDEIETVTETTVTAKPAKEPKGPPAWQLLMEAHRAKIQALGLEEEEQKNFVQIRHAATGHRLYVAKESRRVQHLPTTMPCGGDLGETFSGSNGKISALVSPENFENALAALADGRYGEVRPSKRQKKAVVAAQASEASIEAPSTEDAEEDAESVVAE